MHLFTLLISFMFLPTELPSQAPTSYMSPNYQDYYSQNSPVSENIMLNNNQLQHNTDFVNPPPNLRSNPLNDMTDNQNHLANQSRILQSQNIMVHSPGATQAGYASQQQATCNIISTTPSEVW